MDKVERIEKAVIELDGKVSQPDGSYRSPTWGQLVRLSDGRLSWCGVDSDHYRDGALICSDSEFMEARKRLENKPTEWPEGYFYKIQTSNGYWWFSKEEPRHNRQGEIECEGLDNLMYSGNIGEPFNWRQSLEPRPQPDNKEGEGVEWEPGVDLPPVGEIIEHQHFDGTWHGPAKVFHITKQNCCFFEYSNGGWDKTIDPAHIRPARSHRDKVIEAAQKIVSDVRCWQCSMQDLEVLYDGGALKLPGEEE